MPLSLLPYVVVIALGAGALGLSWWKGYEYGFERAESRSAKRIASLESAMDASRREVDKARAEAEKAGDRVRVEYREKIRVIREKAPPPEVIERVRIEAADCPAVPPTLVCLWNGETAADGACSQGADGATVTVAQLAEATTEARRRFLENQAQLDAIQRWAREVNATDASNND